jgi:integrase
MASFRKRGRCWYFRFSGPDGEKIERRGCPDRRETERMAHQAELEAIHVRARLIDAKALAFRDHEARPLSAHLAEYEPALIAKGGTRKHAKTTRTRAGRVLALFKADRISDITLSGALQALQALRDEGRNTETINHHVRAVKGFARWLWKDGRAREHYLAHLTTSNPEADRRRKRRALTPDEAGTLIEKTAASPMSFYMTGRDRAILYALAIGTGLRSAELRTLTPDRFDLYSDPATVTVLACYAKNGREAVQPLPPTLAERLRPWVALKAPGRPVFEGMTKRAAEMLAIDLKAAEIAPETDSGIVDFHALRGTYISHLVSSGASVKTYQVLARHSTPSLTIGVYAKASLHDIKGAVEALPSLTSSPRREALRASGTTNTHKQPFAHQLPTATAANGRELSDSDVLTGANDPAMMEAQAVGNSGVGGSCRIASDTVMSTGGGI